jgi:putative spermidine/putrescine transport system substrate-binding protein
MENKNSRFVYIVILLFILSFIPNCKKVQKGEILKENKKVILKIHAWEGYVDEYKDEFIKFMHDSLAYDVEIAFTKTTGFSSFVDFIENHDAHLVSPANDLLLPLLKRNLIKSIDTKRINNYNQINPVILETKCAEVYGLLCGVPFDFGPFAIAYNKDVMPEPNSYSVFWDEKNRKRVTIPVNYPTAVIYMTALKLGISKQEIFSLNDQQLSQIEIELNALCKTQVVEYWNENINAQNHRNFDVGTDWGIGVGIINRNYNGNWGFVIPDEGATAWVDTWAMTSNITDVDVEEVAYQFINYMISPRVQAQLARVTSYGLVNPYAARYLTSAEKVKYYLIEDEYLDDLILWQPLEDDVLRKYQELWNRVAK